MVNKYFWDKMQKMIKNNLQTCIYSGIFQPTQIKSCLTRVKEQLTQFQNGLTQHFGQVLVWTCRKNAQKTTLGKVIAFNRNGDCDIFVNRDWQ